MCTVKFASNVMVGTYDLGVGYNREGHDRQLEGLHPGLSAWGSHVFEMSTSVEAQESKKR
jgi:hypothetical protein